MKATSKQVLYRYAVGLYGIYAILLLIISIAILAVSQENKLSDDQGAKPVPVYISLLIFPFQVITLYVNLLAFRLAPNGPSRLKWVHLLVTLCFHIYAICIYISLLAILNIRSSVTSSSSLKGIIQFLGYFNIILWSLSAIRIGDLLLKFYELKHIVRSLTNLTRHTNATATSAITVFDLSDPMPSPVEIRPLSGKTITFDRTWRSGKTSEKMSIKAVQRSPGDALQRSKRFRGRGRIKLDVDMNNLTTRSGSASPDPSEMSLASEKLSGYSGYTNGGTVRPIDLNDSDIFNPSTSRRKPSESTIEKGKGQISEIVPQLSPDMDVGSFVTGLSDLGNASALSIQELISVPFSFAELFNLKPNGAQNGNDINADSKDTINQLRPSISVDEPTEENVDDSRAVSDPIPTPSNSSDTIKNSQRKEGTRLLEEDIL